MNLQDYHYKTVPEYYKNMYLDGFTPDQILYACRKKMLQNYNERLVADDAVEIKITSAVKVK